MIPPRIFCLLIALLGGPFTASAHIGSPNVIFEGDAGPYPVRVVIRPPGVVPGLAEITVRVRTNGVDHVTVLPVHAQAGEEGAPPPDAAKPVPGDPHLFASELWLMTVGSYSVYVNVDGSHGRGTVIVPVASIATEPREMPRAMGAVLLGLAALLLAAAISIVGAALRESVLPPMTAPSPKRIWCARAAMLITGLILSTTLIKAKSWWDKIDLDYRSNRLYKTVDVTAAVSGQSPPRTLTLAMDNEEWARQPHSLVPDHGKLMHLFLIREPTLDVLAHLHPLRESANRFEVALPPLPEGSYRLYADITEESGLAHTLTTQVELPPPPAFAEHLPPPAPAADPDDSWHTDTHGPFRPRYELGEGLAMIWENPESPNMGSLRFNVVDSLGQRVELEPYMGMMSHAVIRKLDGSVFAHLHPAGTISIAAQQVFQLRSQGKSSKIITAAALEEICKASTPTERRDTLRFPYEFPREGQYRIWVQIKSNGTVKTAVFDADV